MTQNETNRLDNARLDADVSVLGDDRGGEPKVSRIGGAPAPSETETFRDHANTPGARPEGDTADEDVARQKATAEARRDVAGRLPKS